jgi:hypothetical protein
MKRIGRYYNRYNNVHEPIRTPDFYECSISLLQGGQEYL